MKKVLFVATVVKTHIMEFHVPYLKMFKEMGWETAVAARNDYENPADCKIPFCDQYYDIPFERSPLKAGNVRAYKDLRRIIDSGHYDIIHCHTPVGAALTRVAAIGAQKNGTRVFYTAHGFHFYKGAPLVNWLVFFPIEWLCSFWTDTLITINKEDYERAKRRLHAKRVEYVPGVGIDVKHFAETRIDRAAKRRELGVPEDAVMLLSVGELNENKNHSVVIRALREINDPNLHYVVAGNGPLFDYLTSLAAQIGASNQVHILGYRTDVAEIYKAADIFVFPSRREGLPVALMEAMACGLICIAARNRGSNDLMTNGSMLFDSRSINELKERLLFVLNSDCSQEIFRNMETLTKFSLDNTVERMKLLYEQESACNHC